VLGVRAQVVVPAVVDPLELAPAERELELDVVCGLRVMGAFVLPVLVPAELLLGDAEAQVPIPAELAEVLEPLHGSAGLGEELELHLLEFPRAKDEVARVDLVPERLSDLGDPERRPLPGRLHDAPEVEEDRLTGLRPQVGERRGILGSTDVRLQHQVELARLGQVVPAVSRLGALVVRFDLVRPEALLADPAVDHRVVEVGHVTRGDPGLGIRDDRRVEPDDVGALPDHALPPGGLHVVAQLDAERTVVPEAVDAAVDLARGVDEPAVRAERHQLVHVDHSDSPRAVPRRAGSGEYPDRPGGCQPGC
jgi:hypothetical protein